MLRTKYFKVKTEERLPIQKNKEYNPGTIHVDPSGRIKDGGEKRKPNKCNMLSTLVGYCHHMKITCA